MGRKVKYVSADRVISKLYRDLGLEEFNESDCIEYIGEALEHIGSVELLEESVAFLEIRNHQAELPINLHSIIQIARNNKWDGPEEKKVCPIDVLLDCPLEEEPEKVEIKDYVDGVRIDCKGTPIDEYEIAYYRPFIDTQYEYLNWKSSRLYQKDFTPIRLANHTLFESLVSIEEDPYTKTKATIQDEYNIQDGVIKTSFKEGQIALAYYRQKTDPSTGYPLVPDEISVIQAITYYIMWKYNQRLWFMGREGYGDKMQYAEKQWIWYCKQAQSKYKMLTGIDSYQNLLETRYRFIPNHSKYYNFFNTLSRKF